MGKKSLRPITVIDGLAYVPLTRGLTATIDAADVELVSGRHWYATKKGATYYAATGVMKADGKRAVLEMHRLIQPVAFSYVVDHLDGDGLNNRRSNLRPASSRQNVCNSKVRSDNTSGAKGVRPKAGKWVAAIMHKGRSFHLGYHATKEEAIEAYRKAAGQYHGEFARRS